MSWLFRRTVVAPTSSVQVALLVVFKTKAGALYVSYIKNVGSSPIEGATLTVNSKQPMSNYQGDWIVNGDVATCTIGTLQPGDEKAASLEILGTDSSAILVATTTPQLADPSSGVAKASYRQHEMLPESVTADEMLKLVISLK